MKKKYLIIGIISILILMIGVSYAYFTSAVVGEGKQISVTANRLAVIFTDTSEIADVEITPGWNTSKTFTVENKSGGVFYYDINIDNLVNTFVTTGYLQYRITSTDGGYNMESFVDIPKSTNIENNEEEIPSESTDGEVLSGEEESLIEEQGEIKRTNLVKNIQIEDKSIHTYKVEFRYQNSEEDQSADMGKIFSGSLSITESNILVVKYKVNNLIQDTIPENTEPYIVDKVECSNNAKGTWNEERETVELVEAVTQTVCIVEFKEGNTITMSTEHGEVVSPVRKVVGRIGSTTFTIEEKAGYSLDNAAIVCDNGAEGSIANKTITITNIKQNNTCKVITNPISITVTYDVNGGNALNPNSKSVIYTSTYGSLPTPTRTGYTFSGWYTATSGGSKVTEDTEVISTVSHTIYARWTANTYTVTYNVNGGSGVSPASNTVTFAGKYKLPTTNPSRAGYTFANWWTAVTGGSQVTTSTDVTNAGNHSIYAHWNANTITLTLNGQSATSAGSIAVYYKYNTNTYYSNSNLTVAISKITVPTKTGYTFGGYYTSTNGGGTQYIKADGTFVNNPYTAIKANTTLYAKWTANTYTVTYNQNNGSGVSPASNTVTFAGKYKLPTTNPTRTGYTFAGWFTAASGGTQVTTNTNVTNASNHSIYAHWTPVTYTITYNLNGGSISGQKTSYTIETATFTLPAPTRDGYTFTGWTGSNGSTAQTSVTISKGTTGNKTYTANWKEDKATFTINGPCHDYNNSNSGACYIIYHKSTTVTYGGKTYNNCSLVSYILKSGNSNNCSVETTNVNNLSWYHEKDSDSTSWAYYSGSGYYRAVSCSVNLSCDPL